VLDGHSACRPLPESKNNWQLQSLAPRSRAARRGVPQKSDARPCDRSRVSRPLKRKRLPPAALPARSKLASGSLPSPASPRDSVRQRGSVALRLACPSCSANTSVLNLPHYQWLTALCTLHPQLKCARRLRFPLLSSPSGMSLITRRPLAPCSFFSSVCTAGRPLCLHSHFLLCVLL